MSTPTGGNRSINDDADPRSRLCRSYLTPELLDDDVLSGILDEEVDAQRGRRQRLALRQRLDRAIRASIYWPREQDYVQIADDMERLGWLEHAATLRDLAGTDDLLAQAAGEWTGRYQGRGQTVPELDMHTKLGNENTHLADADPVRGIDGAWYRRGYIDAADGGHIVLVQGRGLHELIGFGDDGQTCERWVASRGALATGPLDPPPAVQDSRTWQEEQLLAAMLSSPAALARYRDQFPPDAFTADSRYDIYRALLDLADTSDRWYPWQVRDWVAARQDQIPVSELGPYGGDGMPWTRTYLDRLTVTTWTPAAASAAAAAITAQDGWFRDDDLVLGYHATGIHPALADQPRTSPGPAPDSVPLLGRAPGPGEQPGPVPRL
jgi:hypothetical protein